nr:immunoglobulin light chain junction region [Macaca mulatta]MOV92918.1 immunoglobulin light chain junction region [Macaca mulatta]MOV93493.1 immunoglobulin light chain junction region [Macaca mulatta]MOV93577.1 immunoglobulin light chain junction region [Macaca mulatta]MOV93952.1 immunoglobulin light chain junction region [Macaca mulatta]
CQHSYGTLLTF